MNFEQAIEAIFRWEGGYVNHPSDPGGETNMGITKRDFPHLDIKNLTKSQAKDIYYHKYWIPSKAQELNDELKLIHFDTAVNMGLAGSARVLQESINHQNVKVDGIIGPITLSYSFSVTKDRYAFHRALRYMEIIARNQRLADFSRGWKRRLHDIWEKS